jgi:hypothetical protein
MKSIVDSIRQTITALAGPGWRDGLALQENWADIVGPQVAAVCRPQQVRFPNKDRRDGILVLAAPGAARLELQHQTPHIIGHVNQYFGYAAIASIQLVPGEIRAIKGPPAPPEASEISLKEALERLGAALTHRDKISK